MSGRDYESPDGERRHHSLSGLNLRLSAKVNSIRRLL
ncbi:MAG: hypothetical protein JWP89_3146 [Schlesneria sp.]|nr:hypothetical protein [Schlesneria sp.]